MIIFGIVAAFLAFCYINYKISMRWVKIKRFSVEVGLPKNAKGFKILHISDVHNASETVLTLDFFKNTYKHEFDIVVITGDMTVSYFEQILPLKPYLQELAEVVPVFFVDGNHEKIMYEGVKEFLEDCGVHVLANEKRTLEYEGEKFELIGLRDHDYLLQNGYSEFEAIFEDNGRFKLVLQHQPQLFERIKYYENVFMLSGHTHGGQVRFWPLPTLYAPRQGILPKYGNGLYKFRNNHIYISKGIGTTIFPIRFFNRPEVAIIELM